MSSTVAEERTVEPRVMVKCATCELAFDVSARHGRDIAAGRVEARCDIHKKGKRPKQTRTARMRRFWLAHEAGFSMDDIRFMAWATTPKGLTGRQATVTALTAAGHPPPAE